MGRMGRVRQDRSIIRSLKGAEKSFVQVLADGLSDTWIICEFFRSGGFWNLKPSDYLKTEIRPTVRPNK